jgi:hypothetical protein
LRFLFDKGAQADIESPHISRKIPKTIVFFDSKKDAYTAMQECRNWLQKSNKHNYSKKQARETIKVFHRNMAKFDKESIIAEFQQLAEESSIRVICATEALGLGVNLPDIQRVVQYGLPKGEEPAIMWQRGGRAGRDGQDGEIILLIDDWVEGPRIDSRPIPKGCQNDYQSSQNSQLLDEAILAEKQNKTTRLTLPERRNKLSNFWYMLANNPSCLRAQFLDHFDEPQEFRIYIRKDRCCSNCNPDLQLGKLDNHYLYGEQGSSLNARRKKVLQLVTAWAEGQISMAFPNPSFQPTVYCFISEDQLIQLAKDAHTIINLDQLCKALGSWYFFQSYGTELLAKLRAAYYATEKAIPQTFRKDSNQIRVSSQSSQGSNTWATIATPVFMNQSTSSQTIPPLLQGPVGIPASTQSTCQPLSVISGNAPSGARKRLRLSKTAYRESLELAPLRELPASSFGRKRMASQRTIQ